MSAKRVDSSHLIVVKWEPKDIKPDFLKSFIGTKSGRKVEVLFGRKKFTALIQFEEKNKQNVKYLRGSWSDDGVWKIVDIFGIPPTVTVLVSNLPESATRRDIYKYFDNDVNTNGLNLEPRIEEGHFNAKEGWCLMQLSTPEVVKKVCESCSKFLPFREKVVNITRYYEPLEDLFNKTVIIESEVVLTDINPYKYEFLRDFERDKVQTEFRKLCAGLIWATNDAAKVKVTFSCKHEPEHTINAGWSETVGEKLSEILESVKVIERRIDESVWDNACATQQYFDGLVKKDQQSLTFTIVAFDDHRLTNLIDKLDSIKPPPECFTKVRDVKDPYKLEAFQKFGLARKLASDHDIEIAVDKANLQLEIRGAEDKVAGADHEITVALLSVRVQRYDIRDADTVCILNTEMMKDEITILMKAYYDCQATIEGNMLIIYWVGDIKADSIYKEVLNLVKEEEVSLDGTVGSKIEIEKHIKTIVDSYGPLLKLNFRIEESKVIVNLKCPEEYIVPVTQDIQTKVGLYLKREEDLLVAPFLVNHMFKNKYFDQLEKEMKSKKIDTKCLIRDKENLKLRVYGNPETREKIKLMLKSYTEKILTSWTRAEEDGIDVYFGQKENIVALKELQMKHNCSIRIATKNEMKQKNMHCIALLDTGQAIFAGTNDLAQFDLPIDVIVNAANEKLQHKGGLSKQLSKAGGNAIEKECKAYIHKNGHLSEGGVFIGIPGKLNCLKLVHAVGPSWRGGESDERKVLAATIINILKAVTVEKDSVLRSVALPLISTGIFGFPQKLAAKIVMETLKKRFAEFKSIREIYFCDPNPAVVRVIQDQMEKSFGERSYHVPVENIRVGEGTMTKTATKYCLLKRKGTRTLPLPGQKKILIVWGQLETTSAEVIVNTTETAPRPSGKLNAAIHKAAGNGLDLNREIENTFKKKVDNNGQVIAGTLISTKAGRLPSNDIYHIKIAPWDTANGEKNVGDYINSCLQEAMRGKAKSIAFPTIGTEESGYDQVKVAKALIRTIGEFMKLHMNSAIETTKIVINCEDVACTAAFEHVIGIMYSQRPHRLEAVIEETSKDIGRVREEEEKIEREAAHLNRKSKQQGGGQRKFSVTPKCNIELEIGYIENSDTDVIVCTSSSFPALNGAIAVALKKAGGPQIEKDCKDKYKKYPDKGIVSAPGGRLKCQKVYILKLEDYKRQEDGQKIYNYVKTCLEKADVDRFGSVAFPTIGTGGFKFPDVTSATKTFEAIQDFFKRQKTNLHTVRLVMFPQAQMSIQTFTDEATKVFGGSGDKPTQQQNTTEQIYEQNKSSAKDYSWTVPNTKTNVEITFGNLENAQADVILNTTTSFPNLNGIISTSLVKVAGAELQRECERYPSKIKEGDIAETGGYNLKCQKVFHFVLPPWSTSDKQKMIENKVNECLQKMKRAGLHCLALPSIGTGGFQYDPGMVATGTYEAVKMFGETSPDYSCLVKLVLYPPAKDVSKVFTDLLGKAQSEPKPKPKKGVRFNTPDNEEEDRSVEVRQRKMKDFVLFQITSDDLKKEKFVIDDIRKKIKEDTRSVDIDLKKDKIFDDIEILSQEANKKMLLDIGEGYSTKIDIDLKQKKIHLTGMGENVKKCHEKILDEIRDLRSNEGQKKVGNVVYKNVEWCYTEDDGRIWVPYSRRIAYTLEDAFKQNEDSKEFKDSNDQNYVVDFRKMTENLKGSEDKKSIVEVIRKDLAIGDIDALPETWSPMGAVENLREITLKETDQEYKDVAVNFTSTLGAFALQKIGKIKRIQNQALYQQYATKKKQLKTDLKGVANIERTLWHGIKEEAEAFISSNGFNRGFAGQTFGQLWYGQGTYFAVQSEYSTDANYSPIGNDTFKRMYQVKVLTGQTQAVARGYSDRFPPLLPGSTTDRYNSVCDDVNNPKEFVIFSDTQAYPEYIIYYN